MYMLELVDPDLCLALFELLHMVLFGTFSILFDLFWLALLGS